LTQNFGTEEALMMSTFMNSTVQFFTPEKLQQAKKETSIAQQTQAQT